MDDYHFARARSTVKKSLNIKKVLMSFLPLFVLALLLPFLLALIVSPTNIGFLTRADETTEITIWTNPANVIVDSGVPVELEILAQYDGDQLIPEVNLSLSSASGAVLSQTEIEYSTPFKGRAVLGKVTVGGLAPGKTTIEIPEGSVQINYLNLPLTVKTNGTNIIVRN